MKNKYILEFTADTGKKLYLKNPQQSAISFEEKHAYIFTDERQAATSGNYFLKFILCNVAGFEVIQL